MSTIKRAPVCYACTPEQLRLLTSNVATMLAFRYLCPSDERDREDAFRGLRALCWKARGHLAIYPSYSEQLPRLTKVPDVPETYLLRQDKTWKDCTREFIEDFILDYFEPYEGQSEEQVLSVLKKFQYIGHRLQGRMVDEIRTRTALKNREPYREPLEGVLKKEDEEGVSITPDYGWTADHDTATLSNSRPQRPVEFLKSREVSLTDALGTKNFEVLAAGAEAFPHAFEGTHQQAKSALTRAIQRRRGVSAQQAGADKRDLVAKVSEEMQHGNPDLIDLHALLARGDDDHTLREEFISRDGRRRRSIRFRIKF